MGTTPVFRVLQQTMKVLIILPVAALRAAHVVAPVAAVRAAPVVPVAAVRAAPVAAPAVAPVTAVRAAPVADAVAAPAVAEVRSAVPSVTSSQYHAQDEDKNFSFGYSNINSARQESGNAHTGVVGSYSDGFRTYSYVADGLGFRHV